MTNKIKSLIYLSCFVVAAVVYNSETKEMNTTELTSTEIPSVEISSSEELSVPSETEISANTHNQDLE